MAGPKETRLRFSQEHKGSSGKQEWDTYRSHSASAKTEKVGHNDVTPGYGNESVSILVNTDRK